MAEKPVKAPSAENPGESMSSRLEGLGSEAGICARANLTANQLGSVCAAEL